MKFGVLLEYFTYMVIIRVKYLFFFSFFYLRGSPRMGSYALTIHRLDLKLGLDNLSRELFLNRVKHELRVRKYIHFLKKS